MSVHAVCNFALIVIALFVCLHIIFIFYVYKYFHILYVYLVCVYKYLILQLMSQLVCIHFIA